MGFEKPTNLIFEREYSLVLFLNTDRSVRNENINFNANRFWDLQTTGIRGKKDSNLHDFQDSIYLNNEGRYEATLPLKESHETLPDNYCLCEKRLLKLYRNFKNDTILLKNFDAIFVEQRGAGIIENIGSARTLVDCLYRAHHPVFREDKKTSNLRISLDASAKDNG